MKQRNQRIIGSFGKKILPIQWTTCEFANLIGNIGLSVDPRTANKQPLFRAGRFGDRRVHQCGAREREGILRYLGGKLGTFFGRLQISRIA